MPVPKSFSNSDFADLCSVLASAPLDSLGVVPIFGASTPTPTTLIPLQIERFKSFVTASGKFFAANPEGSSWGKPLFSASARREITAEGFIANIIEFSYSYTYFSLPEAPVKIPHSKPAKARAKRASSKKIPLSHPSGGSLPEKIDLPEKV